VWGVGGVLGSFLIGTLVDRFSGPRLTFAIMLLLGIALIALPLLLGIAPWLALIPIALWGAVGWALQVPQNNELMKARESQGDGNLAVALNESALYLGSALGASLGGLALALQMPVDALSITAGLVALSGMAVAASPCTRRGLSRFVNAPRSVTLSVAGRAALGGLRLTKWSNVSMAVSVMCWPHGATRQGRR